MKQKTRSEIPAQYKWRLEDIFATPADWRNALETIKKETAEFKKLQGTLTTGEAILACLRKYDKAQELNSLAYMYAHLKKDEDATVSESVGMAEISENVDTDFSECVSFIDPEILAHDESTILGFIANTPGLEVYEHHLKDLIRGKAHVLSPELEALMAKVNEIASAPRSIFGAIDDVDMKFGNIKDEDGNEVELTHGRYGIFMKSKDRSVRKAAYEACIAAYAKLQNTLAATYSNSVKGDMFFAETRKYSSTLEAKLFGSNIPLEVYEQLIKAVEEYLPVLHKYYDIRKKALNLDELQPYDTSVSLVEVADTKIPYEEATTKIVAGLAPLGEEYLATMKSGLNSGWIDLYENEGKTSGGYCWGVYGAHPYILMNYEDTLDDMNTLAHELGHAMHHHYSSLVQPYAYSGCTTFTAEVASTVNEALLMEHLIKTTTDKNRRIYLLDEFINLFIGVIFTQTHFAEFEKIAHAMAENDEPLTLETLNGIYSRLNEKYNGQVKVSDERQSLGWARIPHFYSSFYVYQYATGYSAALAFAKRLQSGDPQALEDYIGFLKAGNSNYSIEILKKAGVDMSTPQPVKDALTVFQRLVGELEELLG